MQLESVGASPELRRTFETYAAQGLLPARVATAQRDRYRLYMDAGERDAEPSGALWYRTATAAEMPVIGDWVAARAVGQDYAIVEAVLPRRTFFARRAAGKTVAEQGIAANIDVVFLVCGLDGDFNLRRLERYLALAAESGASPVVVLNKSDACGEVARRAAEASAVSSGAPVVPCSAVEPDGLRPLLAFVQPGWTIALLGSSGVGKSTIVNRLTGSDRFATQEVRESDSRGRHTTTRRELIPLPGGGALIDTPGMRELQLSASGESVDRAFDEIASAAASCRYRDCTHAGEPGCAVEAAIAAGEIAPDRWASYRKLRAEARHNEVMLDVLAAQAQKRKWKLIHKAHRRDYKRGL